MRKNKVAIDIVNFGHDENLSKLTALVEAANNSGNSHFVNCTGLSNVTDGIIASPVINEMMDDAPAAGGDPSAAPAPGGGQFAEFGGVDPSLDPELADAIRISMEGAKNQENAAA